MTNVKTDKNKRQRKSPSWPKVCRPLQLKRERERTGSSCRCTRTVQKEVGDSILGRATKKIRYFCKGDSILQRKHDNLLHTYCAQLLHLLLLFAFLPFSISSAVLDDPAFARSWGGGCSCTPVEGRGIPTAAAVTVWNYCRGQNYGNSQVAV